MEHGVLLLRYIVSMIWKSQPEWVEDAKKTSEDGKDSGSDETGDEPAQ